MSFLGNMINAIIRSSAGSGAGYLNPADLQNRAGIAGVPFAQFLANGQASSSLQIPAPPSPPKDPSDAAAQQDYNQALQAYNQQFQAYHTSMVRLLFQRLLMMQQAILQARRSERIESRESIPGSSYSDSGNLGIGEILDS